MEIFKEEENKIRKLFDKHFPDKVELFRKLATLFEKIISSSQFKSSEYENYSAYLLSALNLKSFISAYDLLETGYWSDSETICKKIIEAFLALAYLQKNPKESRKWIFGGNKLGKIEDNRKLLSKQLDILNKEKKFFPTDKEDFFEDYIYKVFYTESCNVAHMNFSYVYPEIADHNDGQTLSNTFTLGPKFIKKQMETSMNRIIMLLAFHLSYFKELSNYKDSKEYDEIIAEVKRILLKETKQPSGIKTRKNYYN